MMFFAAFCPSHAQKLPEMSRVQTRTKGNISTQVNPSKRQQPKKSTYGTKKQSSRNTPQRSSKRQSSAIRHKRETYLSISEQSVNFDAEGGTQSLTIYSNDPWEVSINKDDWRYVSKQGNQLVINVMANKSASPRSDYFYVVSGNGAKTLRVDISQEGITRYVSINDVDIVNGQNGLVIISVSMYFFNMKGSTLDVTCYFRDANGNLLIDYNNYYGTLQNPSYVVTTNSFIPNFDGYDSRRLTLTIPYAELHLKNNFIGTLQLETIVWEGHTEVARNMISFYIRR